MTAATQRFLSEMEAAALLAEVDRTTDNPQVCLLAEAAWHARQRDPRRSAFLRAQARELLSNLDQSTNSACAAAGRLDMCEGEVLSSNGDFDGAATLLDAARIQLTATGAHDLLCDLEWVASTSAGDAGDYKEREQALQRSWTHALDGGDTRRTELCRLQRLNLGAQENPRRAFAAHGEIVRRYLNDPREDVASLAHRFFHQCLPSAGEFGKAIEHGIKAAKLARSVGNMRGALIDLTNVGILHADLGDVAGALKYLDEATSIARLANFTVHVGGCLATTSGVLLGAGRYDAAGTAADDALKSLARFSGSQGYGIAVLAAADASVALGNMDKAADLYNTLLTAKLSGEKAQLRRYAALGMSVIQASPHRDLLGARELAVEALKSSIRDGDVQVHIKALRMLSTIARAEGDVDGALEHLQAAADLAGTHKQIAESPGLLADVATALAATGNFERAYAVACQALTATTSKIQQDNANHAVTTEVRMQTQQAVSEAEAQSRIAAAAAIRAAELEAANAALRTAMQQLETTQSALSQANAELQQAYNALQDLSLTDPLTGLKNRRYLSESIDADVALSIRMHEANRYDSTPNTAAAADLIFFLVDLDHFKAVNDTYGHAAGDEVLMQVKERLLEVFRESDHVVRWGGEEFLAVARHMHRSQAPALAERLLRAMASVPFLISGHEPITKTCSVGVASFPPNPHSPREGDWAAVVNLADERLYAAKHSGRNCWVGENRAALGVTA